MKTKNFDCVEMKRRGAGIQNIYPSALRWTFAKINPCGFIHKPVKSAKRKYKALFSHRVTDEHG